MEKLYRFTTAYELRLYRLLLVMLYASALVAQLLPDLFVKTRYSDINDVIGHNTMTVILAALTTLSVAAINARRRWLKDITSLFAIGMLLFKVVMSFAVSPFSPNYGIYAGLTVMLLLWYWRETIVHTQSKKDAGFYE